MTKFHDDLIAARRRGEAPGMTTATPSGPPEVAFTDLPDSVPVVECSRCGAVVGAPRTPQHADWHRETGV